MAITAGRATSEADRQAIFRLRYAVYVGELGRYRSVADHEAAQFKDPEDDHSWLYVARDGDDIVGAYRMTWGGDGFSERQISQYSLRPFLDELPAELLAVGERSAIHPDYRGGEVFAEMTTPNNVDLDRAGVRLVFGACEPHLLSLYVTLGQVPYAGRNINSEEAGYLIPLVAFYPDLDALTDVLGPGTGLPRCVQAILDHQADVASAALMSTPEYLERIHHDLNAVIDTETISVFDGLDDDEEARCVARSNIIETAPGDRVLKKGGSARNIFVVLDGLLEVRNGGQVVGVLTPGDVFGEMAFLLQRPRAFDVYAATSTRVLSLSEGTLRRMIVDDPVVAAKVLFNISKMLCVRLIRAT